MNLHLYNTMVKDPVSGEMIPLAVLGGGSDEAVQAWLDDHPEALTHAVIDDYDTLKSQVDNLIIDNTTNLSGYNVVTAEGTTANNDNTYSEIIPRGAEILQVAYQNYNSATGTEIKTKGVTYTLTDGPLSTQTTIDLVIDDSSDTRFNVFITYAISQAVTIAELTDIRTGADGTTYPSAGEAVRTQVSDLKNALSDLADATADYITVRKTEELTPYITSGYMAKNGTVYSSETLKYTSKIPVSDGDVFRVYDSSDVQQSIRFVTAFTGETVIENDGSDNAVPSYTVPSGIDHVVLSYNGNYILKKTYNGIDYVNKNVEIEGIEQVTTKNIEGMLATGSNVLSNNLFSKASLIASGKYVGSINQNTGKVTLLDSSTGALDTYILPVDGVSTYTFTHVRAACLVSDLELTAIGQIVTNVTEINSTGAPYILFSFNKNTYPASEYVITKPIPSYYIPPDWIIESSSKKPVDKTSGTISSSGTMSLTGRSALKDGQMIAFKGKFETFSGFTLNFFGTAVTNYISVTGTTIAIKNTIGTPTPVNHGLTIQNEISLTVEFIDGNAKISLYSMGNMYTQTVEWYQTSGTVTQPQITSNGTLFTEANLVTSYDCTTRNLWIFGDSYLGVTSQDRWAYYLKENGYLKNTLLNGSAGGTSSGAMIAFNAIIKYGTPKYAVMATGMNDGSDGETAPNMWIQKRDEFINLCENNGITPIFCTIPTVPSVNNEQKNAWIRASGYRYIDFASAVGADGTGAWYSGMLSNDNVHPSETGAKALYTQVLIDLPEITIH